MNQQIEKAAPVVPTNATTDERGTAAPQNECCKGTTFSPNMQMISEIVAENSADFSKIAQNVGADLPVWGLPKDVQDIIETYADVLQCPRAFITGAVLSVASVAAGTSQTATDGKYINTPCIWVCYVAPSGSNKSVPVREMMRPLRTIDAQNHSAYQLELEAYKTKIAQFYTPKGKKRAGAPDDMPENPPAKPICKQIQIDDTTPEARNVALKNNPHGIVQYVDELRGMLDNIGRYNKSGELSQMLTIYDNETIVINRKNDDGNGNVMRIENPFLNIIGSMQPAILQQSFNEQMCSNGFLFRFMFIYPDETELILPEYNSRSIPYETRKRWADIVLAIYNSAPAEQPMQFDMYGKAELEKFINQNRKRINECSSTDEFQRSVLAKQTMHVERLALITAILHGAKCITGEYVQYAAECVQYFEQSMQRIRAQLSAPQHAQREPNKTETLALLFRQFPELGAHKTEISRWLGKSDGYVRKLLNDANTNVRVRSAETPVNKGNLPRTTPYVEPQQRTNTDVRGEMPANAVKQPDGEPVPRTPYAEPVPETTFAADGAAAGELPDENDEHQ